MEILNSIIHYFFSFIILLSVIVFVHELGHYLVAIMNKVKVETFSIGFGKEIIGWNDKRGTRWKISILPFGGYVKMFGEDTFSKSKIPSSLKKYAFSNKTVYRRFMIVAAGPIANFLFAIICYTFLYTFIGKLSAPPIVNSVEKNSPAEIAGVIKDDKILKVNNKIVNNFYDIRKTIYLSRTDFIDFEILRDNNIIVKSIKPTYDQKKQNVPKIGIYSPEQVLTKHPFYFSLYLGIKDTYEICSITLKGLHLLIIGEGSKKDIGGPLKIAEISGKVLEAGFLPLIKLIIILSITIGLINLFPIPVLDGGHIVFIILEAINRGPLSRKKMMYAQQVGMSLLFVLIFVALYNDISKFFFNS